MSSSQKSPPTKNNKEKPAESQVRGCSSTNPFDSDDEFDKNTSIRPSWRYSPEPSFNNPNSIANPFDENGRKDTSSSSYALSSSSRDKYRNDFRDTGGLENQSVQELGNYAVYKAEETTKTVNSCLKLAEEMREDATKTLATLHQQGEQIARTHMVAADIDHDLSRSEKLLGSLGGMFSKTWKPKKTPPIMGPVITRDDPVHGRGNHLEQREKLGLGASSKERRNKRSPSPEPTDALQKVEVENVKQDDALSDISDILGELKGMALDMGSEIDRQNQALSDVQQDVDVLNGRVLDASRRGRRLIGK